MTREGAVQDRGASLGETANAIPIYVRLASALRARIFSGQWAVGDRLPSFESIAAEYRVALNTVRKAVELLGHERLIHSSRGVGTRVLANGPAKDHSRFRAAISDPLEIAPGVSIKILESALVRAVDPALAGPYLMAPRYQRTLKTHSVDGQPFALLDIYVDSSLHARFPKGAERYFKLSRLLRDYSNRAVSASREEMTIQHATPELSKHLNFPIAAPIVRLRRWRLDVDGFVMYACIANYRSDLFVFDVTRKDRLTDHFGQHIIPSVGRDGRSNALNLD